MKLIEGRVYLATEAGFIAAVHDMNSMAEDGYKVVAATALGQKSFGVIMQIDKRREKPPVERPKGAAEFF